MKEINRRKFVKNTLLAGFTPLITPGILKAFNTELINLTLSNNPEGKYIMPENGNHLCWKFTGHIGQYIDKITEVRILDPDNRERIYTEAEEAFRLRDSDRNYPRGGNWSGEFWGKYILTVIAASYYYNSEELKELVAVAVKGLLSTQDENGYIGSYEHSDFVKVGTWNVWTRKYTLWALVEAWELLKDDSVLVAAKRMTDHLISEVGPEAADIIETGTHYGMASSSILQPVVKLYTATGDNKYLEYAEYIGRQFSEHPDGIPDILNKGLEGEPVHDWFPEKDPNSWAKAYEFISCVEGLLELYQVTGNENYLDAVKNIHSAVVKWERTPVGSIDFNEKFIGTAGVINTLSAICDVVYWSRLSFKLFKATYNEKYIDEFERTFYNSVLCSFNRDGSWGLRRLRMSHIHIPATNQVLQNHQCCVDNLPRSLFQAAEIVLTAKENRIYLSLFTEGTGEVLLPSGQMANIEIAGDFFEKDIVKIKLSLEKREKFCFLIRDPRWSSQTRINVNGTRYEGNGSEGWISIDRNWNNGDQIEVLFDLQVGWEVFDREKFSDKFKDISFYQQVWANAKFSTASNEDLNKKYEHVESLSLDDALPDKPAVVFFYGPLALARDMRLTEGDIFGHVRFDTTGNPPKIRPVKSPPGIWKAFEMKTDEGKAIRFCDFSSAGNTWDNNSVFNTWCILKDK